MNIGDFLSRLANVTQTGPNSWSARCPAHDDHQASLHVTDTPERILLHCFGQCDTDDVIAAMGLQPSDLFHNENTIQAKPKAQTQDYQKYGLLIQDFAAAKNFTLEQLEKFGVRQGEHTSKSSGKKHPAVLFPYWNEDASQCSVRKRMTLKKSETKDLRFLWEDGHKPMLYGLWRKKHFPKDHIYLVEGESDSLAMWVNGYPCLGMPGVGNFKIGRDDLLLAEYDVIFVHLEKDSGGLNLWRHLVGWPEKGLQPSSILDKMMFFSLADYKDPSDAWVADPEHFKEIIDQGTRMAVPADQFLFPKRWEELIAEEANKKQRRQTDQEEKQDGRSKTSAANGSKGGRPPADVFGCAKYLADQYRDEKGRLTLRHWREEWYKYDGCRYKVMLPSDIQAEIITKLHNQSVLDSFNVKPTCATVKDILANMAGHDLCGLPNRPYPFFCNDPDKGHDMMPMQNCILDIEKAASIHYDCPDVTSLPDDVVKTFRMDPTPEFFSLTALPYPYDPAATSELFDAYLVRTFPDVEVRKTVMALFGLALVPDTSYEVCFFLSGEAGTGKSTMAKVLQQFVSDDNCCSLEPANFTDKFQTWVLGEKLLNIVGELPEATTDKMREGEHIFKDSISGGKIHYEKKHMDSLNVPCRARHVFATNVLPQFFDKSEAIWDRLIIIPFTERIRNMADRKLDYAKTLIIELPGIFNKALAALGHLRTLNRFPEAPACLAAKMEHRERCDHEAVFIRETFVAAPNLALDYMTAYETYRKYLTSNGYSIRSSGTFKAAMERIFGIKLSRDSTTHKQLYRGIGFAPYFNQSQSSYGSPYLPPSSVDIPPPPNE